MSGQPNSSGYVCLLRGVNVGGHNKIRMKELEEALTDVGLIDIRSYIQSGNVVFRADAKFGSAVLEQTISATIKDRFGHEVPAMVMMGAEFRRAVERFPFAADSADKSVLVFLSGEGSETWVERAQKHVGVDEQFAVIENVVYIHCPNGISKSKTAEALLAKPRTGVKATMRNWRTVNRVVAMLDQM